ncbi:hypothetical protein EMIT0P260_90251 [Pseudomonas sp. IT-P260]
MAQGNLALEHECELASSLELKVVSRNDENPENHGLTNLGISTPSPNRTLSPPAQSPPHPPPTPPTSP